MIGSIEIEREDGIDKRLVLRANHPWDMANKLKVIDECFLEEIFKQENHIVQVSISLRELQNIMEKNPSYLKNGKWIFSREDNIAILESTKVHRVEGWENIKPDYRYFLNKNNVWFFAKAGGDFFPLKDFLDVWSNGLKVERYLNSIDNLKLNNPSSDLINQHEKKVKNYSVKVMSKLKKLNQDLISEYLVYMFSQLSDYQLIAQKYKQYLIEQNHEKLTNKLIKIKNNKDMVSNKKNKI